MTTSIDVYAQTNPAFLGIILHQFVIGYQKGSAEYPDYPLMFLPCPITLSRKLARTMAGTNASTGLAKWYLRSPEVQIGLAEEVRCSVGFTRRAIEYDLLSSVLDVQNATFLPMDNPFRKKLSDPVGGSIEDRPFTVANRLGQWCGQINSTERIFALLGLRP